MKNRISLLLVLVAITSLVHGQDKPRYQIETHRGGVFLGNFDIELYPSVAPNHVHNFDSLVNMQFYDSTAFHRVVPGFVIQGGDPNSIHGPISTWGQGQPWQVTVNAEFSVVRHYRGRIGAARDLDTNSANSQFYICVANAFSLDGQYTVYGHVTSGMDIVDTIVNTPRNADDVPLSKIEMFITYLGVNDTVPVEPVLTTPADNAADVPGGVNFQWSAISDAALYNFQLSTDSTFTIIDVNKNAGANTTSVTGSLVPYTTYYWRVKTDNGGHQSPWSLIFRFTTGGPSTLVVPANNATNVPVSTIFRWTDVPVANFYTLQIDDDSTFTLPLVATATGITDTSRQVNNLPANTVLYWRVRYFAGGVGGFYSDKFTFTTGSAVSIAEATKSSFIKNIYPVPAKDKLFIELNAPVNSRVTFEMKDISGRSVLLKQVEHLQDNRMELNTNDLAKGIYILTVSFGSVEETKRIEIN